MLTGTIITDPWGDLVNYLWGMDITQEHLYGFATVGRKVEWMRALAHDLLATAAAWWQPGYVKTLLHGEERPLEPIYFRISIDEPSGHQARSVA